MATPTLSQILAYDPQHLVSAAQHWDETAQLWTDTLGEFHASAQGLDFHGRTAEAVRDSAARQHQGAMVDADKLRQAASIASNAADELRQGRQRVLNVVEHARNNNFTVSDTYQVTDNSGSHNQDSLARQVAAQQMSADMMRYAGELYAHDADTAGRMVQAVDFTEGQVQCFGPDEQHTYCAERQPDGSLITFPGIPAQAGNWPDAAHTGANPGATMLDNTTGHGLDSPECRDALQQAETDRENMAKWAAGIGLAAGAVGGPETAVAGAFGMGALGALWYQYTHKVLPGVCQ